MFYRAVQEGRNGLLPAVGVLLFLLLGIAVGQLPLLFVGSSILSAHDDGLSTSADNVLLLLLLLGFVGGLLMLLVVFPLLHKRSFKTLITEDARIDVGRLFVSFALWFVLVALADLMMFVLNPSVYHLQFDAGLFLPLLLIALLILPLQTSLEELVFRGYLIQQLGLLFRHPLAAIGISAVFFGLMHGANPEVAEFGMGAMMFYYISFGVILGICVVLDGRLEVALGMHAANNIYGATIVSFQGSALQTPTIFYQSELDITSLIILYLIFSTAFVVILSRRYKWDFSLLRQKVFKIQE